MTTQSTKPKCVICKRRYNGFGNNAQPVAEGYCCDRCNAVHVIPARLFGMKSNPINNTKGNNA